ERDHLRAAVVHGADLARGHRSHCAARKEPTVIPPSMGMRLRPSFLKGPRSLVTGTATDWAYATGWMAVRALPEFAARNAFDAGARYTARNGGPDQLRKNLARVIGVRPAEVPNTLMRASLESYGR